jgi:glucoamylase
MYILCAPHFEIGLAKQGPRSALTGTQILAAHKGNTWLVISATVPFSETSCEYVGVNDG